jgi:hypothetical protein
MNLHVLPHKLAILAAVCAFGAAWVVGLSCDVPIDRISLRALLAAAAFWAMGLMAGRLIVNGICEAFSEQAQARDRAGEQRGGGDK